MNDLAPADRWPNAVSVVLLEHAEVAVTELVCNEFDGHAASAIRLAAECRRSLGVHSPSIPDAVTMRLNSLRTALASLGRPSGDVNTRFSSLDQNGPMARRCSF